MTRPRVYCVVYGCLNTSNDKPHLSFFKLPANEQRRSNWLSLIGREDLVNKTAKNYTVCEAHFYDADILPGKIRKKLKMNALPALHLPDLNKWCEDVLGSPIKEEVIDIPMDISPEMISKPLFTQQEISSTSKDLNYCIKPEKTYEEETEYTIEHLHKMCDKFLTKEMAELIKTQTYLTNNSRGACFKQFCLNLYLTDSKAYRLLQNALCLPCPKTIKIPITTNVNSTFMLLLKSKVSRMTEMDKICSVIIDTVSLNSKLFYNIKYDSIIGLQDINGVQTPVRAKVAFVMAVRGLFDNWTQPVGYALLEDYKDYTEIYKWIDDLLEKLFAIGLNVRTFASISLSGLYIFNPAENKSISVEKPYFFIGNRKIYYIFDAPHLFKLLRNNFIENNFKFQEFIAEFRHVATFYSKDRTNSLKIAPKLTNSHFHPNNYEKTKVIYAAQLLSNSVAAGMSTYINFNSLCPTAEHTAEFIKLMNDLFDLLNSADLKSTGLKGAFRGEESQIQFVDEMLLFFQKLTLINSSTGVDVTSRTKFIEGFQITLISILQLFGDLSEEGYKYLLTRRLNLDVLESFYDQVRKSCGMAAEPTANQFVTAFRKWSYSKIIALSNRGNRISNDIGEILNEIQLLVHDKDNVCQNNQDMNTVIKNHEDHFFKIKSSDYNQLNLSDITGVFDVSVFLLTKCFYIHRDCEVFKSYIKPSERLQDFFSDENRSQHDQKYSKIHMNSLLVPPDHFVQYVEDIDDKFVSCMQQHCMDSGILALSVKEIDKVVFSLPCPCFPKDYLIRLFARLRIYATLKQNNAKLLKVFSVKHLKK